MNADHVRALLERFKDQYQVFALRKTENENLAAGDALAPSRRWWDGEPVFLHTWILEEESAEYEKDGYIVYHDRDEWCYHILSYMLESDFDHVIAVKKTDYMMEAGTCGIHVTPENVEQAMELIAKYKGDQLVLMAGNSGEEGYDKGEIIIPEATVIFAWAV